MTFFQISLLALFVLAYVLITFEHKLATPKSAIALCGGPALYALLPFFGIERAGIVENIHALLADILNLVGFLLAAMVLVETLVSYGFFDLIGKAIDRLHLPDVVQAQVLWAMTFLLSALLDNLTVTIVMVRIATVFFGGSNLLVVAAGIVLFANSGGAWFPLGDVTTLMLWLAGKFSAGEVVTYTLLPSVVYALIAGVFIRRQIRDDTPDLRRAFTHVMQPGDLLVIILCLLTFPLAFVATTLSLPPFMGLFFGLGLVWLVTELQGHYTQETHLHRSIVSVFQRIDLDTLLFITGILMMVGALDASDTLARLSELLFGTQPDFVRVVSGNVALGVLSAVVDNVPLTALVLDIVPVENPAIWSLFAYTVGTGGSLLLFGSVAGVVAAGVLKKYAAEQPAGSAVMLDSGSYFRIATLPAAVAYSGGILVWLLQRFILG